MSIRLSVEWGDPMNGWGYEFYTIHGYPRMGGKTSSMEVPRGAAPVGAAAEGPSAESAAPWRGALLFIALVLLGCVLSTLVALLLW